MNEFFLSPEEVQREIKIMREQSRREENRNLILGWFFIVLVILLFSGTIILIARHPSINVTNPKE